MLHCHKCINHNGNVLRSPTHPHYNVLPGNCETKCDHPQLKRQRHGHGKVLLFCGPLGYQISAIKIKYHQDNKNRKVIYQQQKQN